MVAGVCHLKVYAIGGCNDNYTVLDTLESIQVSSLLETETSMTIRQTNSQWTRLQCHLLSPQVGCEAVIVHNCYVVILGGHSGSLLASLVDILDTVPHDNNNGEPTIVARPSLNWAESFLELL